MLRREDGCVQRQQKLLLPPLMPSLQRIMKPRTFDADHFLQRLDGDLQLAREIADLFLEDVPTLLDRVGSALTAADPEALRQAAHALKGAVANFEAQRSFELARKLEGLGQQGTIQDAAEALSELQNELEQLREELGSFLDIGSGSASLAETDRL